MEKNYIHKQSYLYYYVGVKIIAFFVILNTDTHFGINNYSTMFV